MAIQSVMAYNHLSLCRPLLFLLSIFPSIRVFSNESALPIRWPKYWSFSFSISPSNEYSGLISQGGEGWNIRGLRPALGFVLLANEAEILNVLGIGFLSCLQGSNGQVILRHFHVRLVHFYD